MWCFVSLFLVVTTSAVDCLERLVSEMTCYVSSGTLNPTHLLTHFGQISSQMSLKIHNAEIDAEIMKTRGLVKTVAE